MIEVKNTLNGELNASIIKEYPELENITITPTQEEQKLKSEKYGFGDVTVKAIDSDEIVIIPSKEEQVKEGLFNKVSVGAIKTEEITVTPSKEEQIEEGLFDKVTVKAIETQELVVTPSNEEQNFSGLFDNVTVEASSGIDTSDATATSEDIAKDKTAYVNGEKITGTSESSDCNATLDTTGLTTATITKMLTSISKLDTSNITSMSGMFSGYSALKTVPLFNTSNVTSMASMFMDCKALEEVPLFDTSNVTSMATMFMATNLKTIPLFNTSNVTSMSGMFFNADLETMPLLNTSKVTTMMQMFYNCSNLVTIPILDTSSIKGTGMSQMFNGCDSLSNESLNNILEMCTNATKITSNKTLAYVGLTSAQATTCQSLSNYQAFLDAGWVTGY